MVTAVTQVSNNTNVVAAKYFRTGFCFFSFLVFYTFFALSVLWFLRFLWLRLSGEQLHCATGPLGKSVPKSSATTPERAEL